MAGRRLLFGDPPFRYLAEHLAQDAEFLDDARLILGLDDDAYSRIATQLVKSSSFLGRDQIESIVCDVLGDNETSQSVVKIINRLARIVHDADMNASEAMDELARTIEKSSESLELTDRRELIVRLRALVAEPIGIAKQIKAHQLAGATGAELDDFRVFCDVRPIFDRDHERIDGALPLMTMRLEYTKLDGESDVTELRITENQLAKLSEKLSDAKFKLRLIRNLLGQFSLPIPKTKATLSEGES